MRCEKVFESDFHFSPGYWKGHSQARITPEPVVQVVRFANQIETPLNTTALPEQINHEESGRAAAI